MVTHSNLRSLIVEAKLKAFLEEIGHLRQEVVEFNEVILPLVNKFFLEIYNQSKLALLIVIINQMMFCYIW